MIRTFLIDLMIKDLVQLLISSKHVYMNHILMSVALV